MLKHRARSLFFPQSSSSVTTIVLALALFAIPLCAYAEAPASVFVNGMRVDVVPIVREGTAYLPIQTLAQAMKAEIKWNAKMNCVTIDNRTVSAAVINNGGRIYIAAESCIGAAGGTVNFDGRNNRIIIDTAGSGNTSSSVQSANITAAGSKKTAGAQTQAGSPTFKTSNSSLSVSPSAGTPSYTVTSPAVSSPVRSASAAPASSQTGTPASYAPNQIQTKSSLRPADAPPYLSSNLQAGPIKGMPDTITGGSAAMPSNAQRPQNGSVYVPKHSENQVFRVTVTNLETISILKDFYRPKEGFKYVVVYLSQQNISQQVQIYTGRFSLMDQKSNSYDYIEGLSNFWLVILRPYGVNFGYLVFEVPADSKPVSLLLHSLNQAPLAVEL